MYVTFSNANSFWFFFETSKGHLPPEQSSDRRETLAKRVSDDLQFFIFRRWNLFLEKRNYKIFGGQLFFQLSGVLEELWGPKRHGRILRKKLLPVVRLFLGRVPWRRGQRLNMCWNPRLGTENDFNHLVFLIVWWYDITNIWSYDDMVIWYYENMTTWWYDDRILW